MTATTLEAIALASLPDIKQPLDGGTFVGVITMPDGSPYAVVKIDAKPKERMSWKRAMAWAAEAGGQLPSRAIAALLFSIAKDLFEPTWYWTCEPYGSSYAWHCYFDDGTQGYSLQSGEGGAVAVRMIPLTA